ncbi:MAG: hypothetical protein AAF531_01385 [Actinomycetota bacterium]
MADWRHVLLCGLLGAVAAVGCSGGDGDDQGRAAAVVDAPVDSGEDSDPVAGPAVTTVDAEAEAPTTTPPTLVTEEQVAEGRSGYDPDDASVGQPIEVVDPDGIVERAEAFIPDGFPEDRLVIDQLIEGETAITRDFSGYEVVLLYEPLPHCGRLPSLQAAEEDGALVLSVVLDKSGECSDLAFTAAVGVDVADAYRGFPIVATNN